MHHGSFIVSLSKKSQPVVLGAISPARDPSRIAVPKAWRNRHAPVFDTVAEALEADLSEHNAKGLSVGVLVNVG